MSLTVHTLYTTMEDAGVVHGVNHVWSSRGRDGDVYMTVCEQLMVEGQTVEPMSLHDKPRLVTCLRCVGTPAPHFERNI